MPCLKTMGAPVAFLVTMVVRVQCEAKAHSPVRRGVFLRGVIQGVGFRPFVHGLATRLGIGGFVQNRADGVSIEAEGDAATLDFFVEQLQTACPRHARIEEMHVTEVAPKRELTFRVDASVESGDLPHRFFSADRGTCEACLSELFDPADRRYRYPFVNCAHCGPRLTIIREAPYDRERTTMAGFPMCDACRAEYENPRDRRFHAQPIACPACGPRLAACDASGNVLDAEPLAYARELLLSGRIVAVKGLGGYHLACDATSDAAVEKLRARKHRDQKPFAVMVSDVESARRLCRVSQQEADLLRSPCRAIVLLQRIAGTAVADRVAPDNPVLGVMLPYTPLHHVLIRELCGRPLLLTSGNRSDEPIVFEDDDAIVRLAGIADGFLTHDRPIQVRCDDSVARVLSGRSVVLRRSRGYAPEPIRLAAGCAQNILALGGHLKNTFALGRGRHAVLSHHLGDLGDYSAYTAFRAAILHYRELFAFDPQVLVHDLHPGYATTQYALEMQELAPSAVRLMAVQHHHAHMAGCMAENGLTGPVIGVTFDGTGYGTDGSSWGGEFLIGDYRSFRRAAHLRAVALPGGEQAIREPWRMALSHMVDCGEEPEQVLGAISPAAARVLRQMIEQSINSPPTSSMGRLFDAVAALLGLRARVAFEGQAAMELEWLASTADPDGTYPFEVVREHPEDALVVDTRPLVRAIAGAIRRGDPAACVARRFHDTVAEIVVEVARRLHEATGIGDVVLSGGVFNNALLTGNTTQKLEGAGLCVHSHSRVPSNDGGLSLGQLAVAAAALEGGARCV
jgi:hydrogenase maturation protein HypF